jgi:hypothetical protein
MQEIIESLGLRRLGCGHEPRRAIRGSPRVGKVRKVGKVRVLIRTTNFTNITNFSTLGARNVARWRDASQLVRRGGCCQIDDRFAKHRGDFVSRLPEVWVNLKFPSSQVPKFPSSQVPKFDKSRGKDSKTTNWEARSLSN